MLLSVKEEASRKRVAVELEVGIRMVSLAWEVLHMFVIESRGYWLEGEVMDDLGVRIVQLLGAACW